MLGCPTAHTTDSVLKRLPNWPRIAAHKMGSHTSEQQLGRTGSNRYEGLHPWENRGPWDLGVKQHQRSKTIEDSFGLQQSTVRSGRGLTQPP